MTADAPALRLPADANADEAAAITAAVERLLAEEGQTDGEAVAVGDPWTDRRFAFAGRVAKLSGEPAPPPVGAPEDPWTAMGRLDRR